MANIDRLAELRRKKGISTQAIDEIGSEEKNNPIIQIEEGQEQIQIVRENGGDDVDLQIQLYKPIQGLIAEIGECTDKLEALRGRDVKSSTEAQRRQIMTEMKQTTNRAMTISKDIKEALQQIKTMNEEFDAKEGNANSARSQIRANLYHSTCENFAGAIATFTESRDAFAASVQDRMCRMIRIVDPTQTDKEALRMIQKGQAEEIIQVALASDHLKEVVEELRSRRDELRMLQSNVEGLYELFEELHMLISLNGESLNVVEERVSRSLNYVQKGEEILKSAKQHQKKSRKCMCVLLMILLVVAIIVITPILITSTK